MWPKEYRDYKIDEPLKKLRVNTGDGITGVEMNDLNGWGDTLHIPEAIWKKVKRKEPKHGSEG